jgi:catechol 2,3-dioxygenase-like lactoylglutathione lyase family enzyme
MKLRSLVPILDVHDVDASIEFYCELLGFTVHDKVEWGGRTEWALLRCDHVQLMLCAGKDVDVEEGGRGGEGMFFLYHENLDSLMVYLGARGYGQVSDALQPQQGRRDFYLRDPDGYVLWFCRKPALGDCSTGISTELPADTMNGKVSSTNGTHH